MLESELQDLIRKGEGAKLEFKSDRDLKPKDMAKLITAFANTNGGQILFGVEDDGSVIDGVQRDDMQEWLMDAVIRARVEPSIAIDYDEVQTGGKKVAVATVPQGVAKPYMVREPRSDKEDCYVRRGSTCQLARRDTILRLYQSSGLLSVEKTIVPGCTSSELDADMVKWYFVQILRYPDLTWESEREKTLANQDFTQEDGVSGKRFLTWFACLLFAKDPCRYIPQAGVRVVVLDSKRNDIKTSSNVRVDERINLPILGRYDDHMNVVDKAQEILKPYISREENPDMSVSNERRVVHDYPPIALRELLVNALVHRDWSRNDTVEVTAYADCLEVTSPGALPNGMTVEKMQDGARTRRNNKILQIMHDCRLMEDLGMGIRSRVIPEMKENNEAEPIFDATDLSLKVILPKRVERVSLF